MIKISYKRKNTIKLIFLYGATITLLLIVIFPTVWMVSISIRKNVEVFTVPPRLIPLHPTIECFNEIFIDKKLMRYLANSYIIAAAVTIISLAVASLAGYGFSRFKLWGGKYILLFVLMTQMFPGVVLSIPYFKIMNSLNLYDTYAALIIADTSFALPFCILMLKSYFDSIPKELDEAAIVDGCSRLGSFWRIILPVSGPVIIATGAFAFILAWNEFLFAITLTKSWTKQTITIGIAQQITQYTREWNMIMALTLLASAPLIIIFIFLQKYLISGLTAGAVKK